MFIITLEGHEGEGAYAVHDEYGENVLYLFVDKDDAMRYAGYWKRMTSLLWL